MSEKALLIPSSDYRQNICIPKPFSKRQINGMPKYSKPKMGMIDIRWAETTGAAFYERFYERFLEKKKFAISLAGIKVKKEEISVDPRKLEPNAFYLFSYKDEKYVARKSEENVVEIYEVVE